MNKKGQLFLIEVVIALSVLIVLISALFSVQTFDPPANQTSLMETANNAIDVLVENGLMFEYLDQANHSYYVNGNQIFDFTNETKAAVIRTLEGVLPPIANFKVFTERYNETAGSEGWERIDVINLQQTLPANSNVISVEYYTPGFYGVFAEFTFLLQVWYEVGQ